jgi:hypothetical protein
VPKIDKFLNFARENLQFLEIAENWQQPREMQNQARLGQISLLHIAGTTQNKYRPFYAAYDDFSRLSK